MRKNHILILVITIVLAWSIGWAIIWQYGTGYSTDGVYYLSAANNFSEGRGLSDFKGNLLVTWPPFFPFLVGTLRTILPFSSDQIGQAVNLLSLAGILLCSYQLASSLALKNKHLSLLPPIACAFMVSFAVLASNFGTDMLFILFTCLFLLTLKQYMKNPNMRMLSCMALVAACASLTRWSGVSLILIGLVCIAIVHAPPGSTWLRRSFVFGFVSSLPLLVWFGGQKLPFHWHTLRSSEFG